MKIYLMRHGEAVSPADWQGGDGSRPLTPTGTAKLKSALEHMRRVSFSANCIVSSPFVRAIETSKIISQELLKFEPLISSELAAGASMDTYRNILLKHQDKNPVWIVGHMPEIAMVIARMVDEPGYFERTIEPGEIAALETGPLEKKWGEGKVLWFRKLKEWQKLKSL